MQRRRLLKFGVVSATVLGVVGSATLWLQGMQTQGKPLTQSAFDVLATVSAVLLAGTVPAEAQVHASTLSNYRARLTETVSGLPPASQLELGRMLSLLASAPGRRLLSSLGTHWPLASQEEIRSALETMRRSRVMLRRQIYHALRDLARAAWYADPTTWVELGYPGPRSIA